MVIEKEKAKGAYLGTETDEKWWKRYRKNKLFMRGSGEYWYDDNGLYFRRFLTRSPLFFAFDLMREVRLGTWHAGKWCMGHPIIKIIWEMDGLRLSSGFIFTNSMVDAELIKDGIERKINAK